MKAIRYTGLVGLFTILCLPYTAFADRFKQEDLFYSKSFTVRANTTVDFAGVSITEGSNAKFSGVGGKVGIAMSRLFTGKTTFTFLPNQFYNFIGFNPDMVIKTLPFAHYFSYIFDITSYLPIKTGKPEAPNISIIKVHTGDPLCNLHIKRLEPGMLMQFKKKAAIDGNEVGTDFILVAPDGTEYKEDGFGVAEIFFHTSFTYWGSIISRIKDWFKKGTGKVIDDVNDRLDEEFQLALRSGEYTGIIDVLEKSENTNIFWEIFKELRGGVTINTGSFADLFEILKDINISETVVSGVGKEGVTSAGMLYELGTKLPFPNLELIVHLFKDIFHAIIGIPKMKFGWPKNDLRIAVVTRYIAEQFFEVRRVIILPKEAADMYYPPYIQNDMFQTVYSADGERVDPRNPIGAYEDIR